MLKRIIGILISAYAVLLGAVNYTVISSILMANGDTVGRSFHSGSTAIFKVCLFFSAVMLITGVLLFFKLRFSMEVYFLMMLAFITTIIYMDPSAGVFQIFSIPAALGLILLLFNRKKAYAYNEVSDNRRK
ncbi:hypothetical protein [Sebaldella sp. S0638]|uniref:hypothetical protein n=1 Tax=Sebaldella sp. S0638 TaxID=2957809 RepID=UPI00209E250E|nr:hypothetical protein [Sebaldella sp. S0638]MCP1225469.1 hypothetical protein [Sebaldella sp. S0638]